MTIKQKRFLEKQVYSFNHQTQDKLDLNQAHLPKKPTTLITLCFCLILSLTWSGCTDDILPPVNLDGLSVLEEPDQNTLIEPMPDMRVQDMMMQVQMPIDQMVLDMGEMDMEVVDGPDGALPMDGERCDPRLRAVACDPGFTCLPIPGGRIHQGRCVASDECSLTGDSGCPDTAPYCHLRGASTECTQASQRMLGESCLDEFNRALPCAEGLVCNYSVCVNPCDPMLPANEQCDNNRQCVNISENLNQNAGFCGAIGACDLFSNAGCEVGQQCTFAVRPDDQELVYFCTSEGLLQEGEQCQLNGTGAQACGVGLICIGSVEGNPTCKRVCDTGAYQGPCPDGSSCREILSQGGGFYIRGIGLCVINP